MVLVFSVGVVAWSQVEGRDSSLAIVGPSSASLGDDSASLSAVPRLLLRVLAFWGPLPLTRRHILVKKLAFAGVASRTCSTVSCSLSLPVRLVSRPLGQSLTSLSELIVKVCNHSLFCVKTLFVNLIWIL